MLNTGDESYLSRLLCKSSNLIFYNDCAMKTFWRNTKIVYHIHVRDKSNENSKFHLQNVVPLA